MRLPRILTGLSLAVAGLVIAAATVACSAGGGSQPAGASQAAGGSSAGGSGGTDDSGAFVPTGGGGSGGTPTFDASTGSGGSAGASQGCATDSYQGELVPLDMYMMLDHSGSMAESLSDGGPSKWSQVTQAIGDFLDLQGTGGISMGIGFFPVAPSVAPPTQCQSGQDCLPYGTTCMPYVGCADSMGATESCWHFDYAKPIVAISPLPPASAALKDAISQQSPQGNTPMAPALAGALTYAQSWAQQHPDHAVFAVLATDGIPTECVPQDVPSIAKIAAGAFAATPSIKTFVIGIGSELTALNQIAQEGGSDAALIVDDSGNTGQQFLDILNKIRGTVSCVYKIPTPEAGKPDKDKVNVYFTPDGGAQSLYPSAGSEGNCGTEKAWYYDDPNNPNQIILCPAACDQVQAEKGKVDVVIGCQTETVK